MLIPQQGGFRAWRLRGGGEAQPEGEGRGRRNASWVALPARSVVAVPMRLQAADPARREAMAQLELEAAGLGAEAADPHQFLLAEVAAGERDACATAYVHVGSLPAEVLEDGREARFAPSVAFQKLVPGEVRIWQENSQFVLAVPHDNGQPLYSQPLTARVLDADAAAEIRCILEALELAGLSPQVRSLCLAAGQEGDGLVGEAFAAALDLPVSRRSEPVPTPPVQPSRLVPAPVLRWRQDRQQQRLLWTGALVFTLVLVAALGAFGLRVALRERSLTAETQRLDALEPELATIRDAQSAWEDLRLALLPELYPVEALHQLVLLLPQENIRLVRFEIREDGLIIDGEASSLAHGIAFKDKLLAAPAFNRWTWDFPQPVSLPDGRATFRAEGRPAGSADPEQQEVTQR